MRNWIVLRPRVRSREIWLEYEDDSGFRWPSREEVSSESFVVSGWKVRVIADLKNRIDAALDSLPEQSGPHTTVRTPLSIFVAVGVSPGVDDLFALIEETIQTIGCQAADALQLVTLSRDNWSAQRPFRLPLRIGWSGADADAALARLRTAPWIDDAVREHALQIMDKPVSADTPPPHIVILGEKGANNLDWIESKRQPRPHLLISFDPAVLSAIRLRRRTLLPSGLSVVDASNVPDGSARAHVVKSLVYGIVHDQPLHEAVTSTLSEVGAPITLISDPGANESLRMIDAISAIVEEAKQLSDRMAFDRDAMHRLLDQAERGRARKQGPRGLAFERAAPSAPKKLTSADERLSAVWHSELSFDEETLGMKPMADAAASIREVRTDASVIAATLNRAIADPERRRALYPHEERRTDIAILRHDLRGSGRGVFVPKQMTLRRRGQYRVRVQIGRLLPTSIVDGTVPPIDAFLPPPSSEDGHVLTVILYPLDFTSASATSKPLVLPRQGPSESVYFDVIAPKEAGNARMRVAIYYELPPDLLKMAGRLDRFHNQLVQSFVITTEIDVFERQTEAKVTTARVEVTQRVAFDRLQSLKPRLASLGFNENPHGSHEFHFKGAAQHGNARVDPTAASESMKTLRSILEEATYVGEAPHRGPRFPEVSTLASGGQRESDFDTCIRRLGRAGHDLWLALRLPLPEKERAVLNDIRAANDRVLQIIRFNPTYVFAWSMLYDYPRPAEQPGGAEAPVCKGFLREKEANPISCGDCLADCLHPDKSEAFCAWGFWGFRHSVEQVLHAPSREDETIQIVEPVRAPSVGVNVGIKGTYADTLIHDLEIDLAEHGGVLSIVSPRQLISTLWSDTERPAIVILLGHYQNHSELGPGIQTAGGGWLMLSDVADREPAWRKPNAIVVLAACESAADDLRTLVSFVNEFANARAAAVVGTETDVFEGLACRLAKAMARDLTADRTLGDAILDFRRSLLRLLSPLGLTVTAYGDADLHLGETGGAQ